MTEITENSKRNIVYQAYKCLCADRGIDQKLKWPKGSRQAYYDAYIELANAEEPENEEDLPDSYYLEVAERAQKKIDIEKATEQRRAHRLAQQETRKRNKEFKTQRQSWYIDENARHCGWMLERSRVRPESQQSPWFNKMFMQLYDAHTVFMNIIHTIQTSAEYERQVNTLVDMYDNLNRLYDQQQEHKRQRDENRRQREEHAKQREELAKQREIDRKRREAEQAQREADQKERRKKFDEWRSRPIDWSRFMMPTDDYVTLGVQRDATNSQIKKSYYRLAKQLHPDKPTGDTEKFKTLEAAYHRLVK